MFRELIQCGAVPVTVLDQIFRQGKGSLIAANAYKMLNNSAALEYGEDFVFLPADNAECAAEIVEREYRRMTAELGIDQVQVLTPYRKSGAVSVNALNERLWNLVNPKMPGKAEMKVRGRIFREKDKVIHNKNKMRSVMGTRDLSQEFIWMRITWKCLELNFRITGAWNIPVKIWR